MYRSLISFGLAAGFLGALLASAPAQDKPAPDKPDKPAPEQPAKGKKGSAIEEYPEYFKTPETVQEF